MRRIVDLNNLWYSDETLVYNSRLNIVWLIVIQFFLFFICYYLLKKEAYFFLIFSLFISIFLIKRIIKLYLEMDIIQLRISSNGVNVKNEDLISWNEIENERIEIIKVAKGISEHDFIFYDKKNNQQVKFRVEELSIGVQEIVKSFEIHRERFNRKKT